MSKFHHQFSFGYSFELFCIFLAIHLFKTSQIYNFKTRLGEICSSDVNATGYSRFFDITAIEVYTVSRDWQKRIFIIIISVGLTRG